MPPGAVTSALAPLLLPIRARANGAVIEIVPFLASASGSPTIFHTCFSPVSSSIKVTVAPNLTVSPDSLEMSTPGSAKRADLLGRAGSYLYGRAS